MSDASLFSFVRYARTIGCVLFATSFVGCSGGGGGTPCVAAQTIAIAGQSTGSDPFQLGLGMGPFTSAATFLYFTAGNQTKSANPAQTFTESGTPILKGSDGTTISGGMLQPVEYTHLYSTNLYGYSSSISGLTPNVTYTVSFASLIGAPGGCIYGSQNAGSFTTVAP